jgi:hypothetical protein
MSGEPEIRGTIAALAARGYESHAVRFNADTDWQVLTWLAVTEELAADAADIARIVTRVDPDAIRV